MAQERSILPTFKFDTFPWFAAIVWGKYVVLFSPIFSPFVETFGLAENQRQNMIRENTRDLFKSLWEIFNKPNYLL